jgi:hypothetical protein
MNARLSILCLFLATTAVAQASIEIDRVENNVIHFKAAEGAKAPDPLTLQAHDLTPIGSLQPSAGNPYFLLAGSPCRDCVQDRSIYVIRPNATGKGATRTSFVYPGKIVDTKSGVVLVESRSFYGKCLTGKGDVYVAFQKERIPRKRRGISTQLSVFVAEAGPDRIYEKLHDRGLPRIEQTLRQVRAKSCFEISGRQRATKPLISLKPGASGADDDDDEDEKKVPDSPESSESGPEPQT